MVHGVSNRLKTAVAQDNSAKVTFIPKKDVTDILPNITDNNPLPSAENVKEKKPNSTGGCWGLTAIVWNIFLKIVLLPAFKAMDWIFINIDSAISYCFGIRDEKKIEENKVLEQVPKSKETDLEENNAEAEQTAKLERNIQKLKQELNKEKNSLKRHEQLRNLTPKQAADVEAAAKEKRANIKELKEQLNELKLSKN